MYTSYAMKFTQFKYSSLSSPSPLSLSLFLQWNIYQWVVWGILLNKFW